MECLLGLSSLSRALVVCHCYRESDEVIRIISARRADDFSRARRNPYARRLEKQVTIRLDVSTLAYFEELADETGIPYQTLLNLCLRECAASRKKLKLDWKPAA